MTKQAFRNLLVQVLNQVKANTEEQLERPLADQFEIELYGAYHAGSILNLAETLDAIFLDEERFYRVINVSVCEISQQKTRFRLGVSGHEPSTFKKTWDSSGWGPFKEIIPVQIRILEEGFGGGCHEGRPSWGMAVCDVK